MSMRELWMLTNSAFCLLISGMLATSSLAEQGDPKAGKVTYDKICATCHGTTGKGDGPAAAVLPTKPRNHTDGKYMNTLTDDYVFKIIKEGGTAVGKAQFMPAWGAQIKDPEIWNVVAYIRTLAVPPYQAATASTPATEEKAASGAHAQKKDAMNCCQR
jgi:mono/diheme cytochrome c family protein